MADLDLRGTHGVTLLAIKRGEGLLADPGADTSVRAGDVVVLLGTPRRPPRERAGRSPPATTEASADLVGALGRHGAAARPKMVD